MNKNSVAYKQVKRAFKKVYDYDNTKIQDAILRIVFLQKTAEELDILNLFTKRTEEEFLEIQKEIKEAYMEIDSLYDFLKQNKVFDKNE